MRLDILISHNGRIMHPVAKDTVTIDWERKGQPGKMSFSAVKTKALKFYEGDSVRFSYNGKALFQGFVFGKDRTGQDGQIINITAYDQIYYLAKNKETYVLENKTASDVIRMVSEDFMLRAGVITPTPFVMESRVEDNAGLLDICQASLDLTKDATGQTFTLFDKAGYLTLLPEAAMFVPYTLNIDTIGDFSYSSSIADDTYNRVKLTQEKDEQRQVYLAQDPVKMAKWGVLQYSEKLDGDENGGQAKAQTLLAQLNRKTRELQLRDIKGDTRVRGGSMLPVMLGLGDMNLSSTMRVEQVQHTFSESQHLMSLRLSGGAFGDE